MDSHLWESAELIGDHNFYICHRINARGNSDELGLFRLLLRELVALLPLSLEERSQRADQVRSEARASARNAYAQMCVADLTEMLGAAEQKLRETRSSLRELKQQLTQAVRSVEQSEAELAFVKQRCESQDEDLKREYDLLVAMEEVTDVLTGEEVVYVITDPILSQDSETKLWHRVGRLRVEFYLNGSVRVFNLDSLADPSNSKFQAPHVELNGKPCLGTAKKVLPDLVQKHEFAAALSMLLGIIRNPLVTDRWGRVVRDFPTVQNPVNVSNVAI